MLYFILFLRAHFRRVSCAGAQKRTSGEDLEATGAEWTGVSVTRHPHLVPIRGDAAKAYMKRIIGLMVNVLTDVR